MSLLTYKKQGVPTVQHDAALALNIDSLLKRLQCQKKAFFDVLASMTQHEIHHAAPPLEQDTMMIPVRSEVIMNPYLTFAEFKEICRSTSNWFKCTRVCTFSSVLTLEESW